MWKQLSIKATENSNIIEVTGDTSGIEKGSALYFDNHLYEITATYFEKIQLRTTADQTITAEALVIPTSASFEEAAKRIRELSETTVANYSTLETFWTALGTVTFKAYDGQTFTVKTARQMVADVDDVEQKVLAAAEKATALIHDYDEQLGEAYQRVIAARDHAESSADTATEQASIATIQAETSTSQASASAASAQTATEQATIATTQAETSTSQASASAASAQTATEQATIATTQAKTATSQASASAASAQTATEQATIATTQAETSTSQASASAASAQTATEQATIATTQAEMSTSQASASAASAQTATEQATIATTQAEMSTSQASASAASAQTATEQATIATTQAEAATSQAGASAASAQTATKQAARAEELVNAATGGSLLKDQNLADLSSTQTARQNLNVYSTTQIDKQIAGRVAVTTTICGKPLTDNIELSPEDVGINSSDDAELHRRLRINSLIGENLLPIY